MTTPRAGQPTQSNSSLTSRSPFPARTLLAAVMAALLALSAGGPAFAAPLDVHASDASAPDGRLIVFWRAGAPGADSTNSTLGSGPRYSLVVAAPGTAATVAASWRANPDVAAVVPDAIVTASAWPADSAPNDPEYAPHQADLPLIGVPAAWQTTTGDPGTVVAVLDTGFTAGHQDLAGIPLVAARNEITNTTNVADGNGHGTHVSGTIAAGTNNGIGIAGIAPGVSLMPVKVLSDTGSGYFSDILDGINWAVAHGASVINMSLGGTLDATSVANSQPIFDAAAAAGVVVVASAGNSGNSTVSYPAAFDHVISVAATDNSDAIASFSTRNAYVDIAAPGVSIMSTLPGDTYAAWSGTSMAAPHISAVAALVHSLAPTWTPAQIEYDLESTAVDLGASGRDNIYGWGRVNAAAAVAGALPPTPVAPAITTQPLSRSVVAGAIATFSAAASGSPVPTVQWQSSPDGSSWTDIAGATAATYSFTAASGDSGRQFHAVFTNSLGSATTAAATLTVTVPVTPVLTVTKSGSGTVTSTPAGISCGSTCSATFASGTSVSLSAAPASGSSFSGWSGACTGTGSCTVSMTAARAVTATFTLPLPTVSSFSPTSGAAGTSVTISGTGFTGATAVAFNGTAAATFTVGSSTRITATVPVGATTGRISVTTATGTGTSSSSFTVRVATTLTANVPASAARSARITLKATLLAAGGAAISGQTVRFTLNGTRYSGTTSTSGVASVSARAPSSPGSYAIAITYAGSTTYAASSVSPSPILVVQ